MAFGACGSTPDPALTPAANSTSPPAVTWTPPPVAPTSISKLLPDERDPHRVVAARSADDPLLARLVADVEASDFEALFELVPRESKGCEDVLGRGGNLCEFYGVTPGVPLEWSMLEGPMAGPVPVAIQRDELAANYAGRPLRLELVALQDDIRYYLIFGTEPGSPAPRTLSIVYSPRAAFPIVAAEASGYGGPPLEFVRFDTHNKLHRYEVLAAADSFHARELAWQHERDANGTAPPADHN